MKANTLIYTYNFYTMLYLSLLSMAGEFCRGCVVRQPVCALEDSNHF